MLAISDMARGEPADDAGAAVRQLYEHHARALRRYVERFCPDQGHTLAKVARLLGIPDRTARSRLHYALQALRRQLEDREAIESR
jgi:DNA-directed RNA polymerase specialized sigma24 family protein